MPSSRSLDTSVWLSSVQTQTNNFPITCLEKICVQNRLCSNHLDSQDHWVRIFIVCWQSLMKNASLADEIWGMSWLCWLLYAQNSTCFLVEGLEWDFFITSCTVLGFVEIFYKHSWLDYLYYVEYDLLLLKNLLQCLMLGLWLPKFSFKYLHLNDNIHLPGVCQFGNRFLYPWTAATAYPLQSPLMKQLLTFSSLVYILNSDLYTMLQ